MSGVSIYLVSNWLGHSSITITEKHYTHLAPGFQKEEISKLDKLTSLSLVNEKSAINEEPAETDKLCFSEFSEFQRFLVGKTMMRL